MKQAVILYEYQGAHRSIKEISSMTGIPMRTLRRRLCSGKTLEEAIALGATRADPSKLYNWHGSQMTLLQIGRETGLNPNIIRERIHKGWPLEKAATTPTMHGAGITLRARKRANIQSERLYTEGMSSREAMRCNAIFKICKTVLDYRTLDEIKFRCITPMTEYMFESELIRYFVRIESGDIARLTAEYTGSGMASSLNRTFKIHDDRATEIHKK